MDPQGAAAFIREAFSLFASGRPRPAQLSIPLDVLDQPAEGDWSVGAMAPRPRPDDDAIAATRALLAEARRPAILLGGGAVDVPQARIVQLAEEIGAAVVTTTAGKGLFPDSHPQSLGATLSRAPTQ
ncbi:MAG: hypothetical protein JSU82_07000, partial [Rhodospirillales bacterium]